MRNFEHGSISDPGFIINVNLNQILSTARGEEGKEKICIYVEYMYVLDMARYLVDASLCAA